MGYESIAHEAEIPENRNNRKIPCHSSIPARA